MALVVSAFWYVGYVRFLLGLCHPVAETEPLLKLTPLGISDRVINSEFFVCFSFFYVLCMGDVLELVCPLLFLGFYWVFCYMLAFLALN